MSVIGVSLFWMIVLSVVSMWATLWWLGPAVARARFIEEVSHVRDDCDDAIISGQLSESVPVRTFISRTEAMIQESGQISLSLMLAIHGARAAAGVTDSSELRDAGAASYETLPLKQRRLMYEFDQRLVSALKRYLIHGSRAAVLLRLAQPIYCSWPSPRAKPPMATPGQLAEEYNRAPMHRPLAIS